MHSNGSFWGLICPYSSLRIQMALYRSLCVLICCYGSVCVLMGSNASLSILNGLYGYLKFVMRPYWSSGVPIVPYVYLWILQVFIRSDGF